MIEIVPTNLAIGIFVIIINLIPLITKKYNYLLLTAILSLIAMYVGMLI